MFGVYLGLRQQVQKKEQRQQEVLFGYDSVVYPSSQSSAKCHSESI